MTANITCTGCTHSYADTALFCPNCGRPKVRDAGGDALLGKILGERFQVQQLIGQGASGAIYRAEHITLRRKVAIKVLHAELSRDDLAVERFRREATTVAEIDNEHIVEIHDFGRSPDGRLYLAMELLEGETLDTILARERTLSVERTADVLIQVGEALMEAHAIGYVHRDLRPRNIYLAVRRGRANFVKLLDFGLAKLVESDASAAATNLGMTFGDARYMAPEQARGDRMDRRADIYQLGCVAYEMLTGAPPFGGNRVFDILMKQVTEAPQPLPAHRRDIPLWMEAAVTKMLAKDPANRFATTTRMVEALRRGLESGEVMDDEVARRAESVPPPSVSRLMHKMGMSQPAEPPAIAPAPAPAPQYDGSKTVLGHASSDAALPVTAGSPGEAAVGRSPVLPAPAAPAAPSAVAATVAAATPGAVPPSAAVPAPGAVPPSAVVPVPGAVPPSAAVPVPGAVPPSAMVPVPVAPSAAVAPSAPSGPHSAVAPSVSYPASASAPPSAPVVPHPAITTGAPAAAAVSHPAAAPAVSHPSAVPSAPHPSAVPAAPVVPSAPVVPHPAAAPAAPVAPVVPVASASQEAFSPGQTHQGMGVPARPDSVELLRKRTGTPRLGVPVVSGPVPAAPIGPVASALPPEDPSQAPVAGVIESSRARAPGADLSTSSSTGGKVPPGADPQNISQVWFDDDEDGASRSQRARKTISPSVTDLAFDDELPPRGRRWGLIIGALVVLLGGAIAIAMTVGGGSAGSKQPEPQAAAPAVPGDPAPSTLIDLPDAAVAVEPPTTLDAGTGAGANPAATGRPDRKAGATPGTGAGAGTGPGPAVRRTNDDLTYIPPPDTGFRRPGGGSDPAPPPPTPPTPKAPATPKGVSGSDAPEDPYGSPSTPSNPGNPGSSDAPGSSPQKQAEFFASLGAQQVAAGDSANAAASFKKALELDPKSVTATIGMGEIALRQGLSKDALAHLQKAARLAPRNARVLVLIGDAHLNLNSIQSAAASYKKALQLDPDNARARDGYNEASSRMQSPADE